MDTSKLNAVLAEADAVDRAAMARIGELQASIEDEIQLAVARRKEAGEKRKEAVLDFLESATLEVFTEPYLAAELYTAGWSNGMGMSGFDEAAGSLATAEDLYIRPHFMGWRSGHRRDDDLLVLAWPVQIPHESLVDQAKLQRTADWLEKLYVPFEEYGTGYSFDVSERSCSADGSYSIRKEGSEWSLNRLTYGSGTDVFTSENLVDVLAYMSKNCYNGNNPSGKNWDEDEWDGWND